MQVVTENPQTAPAHLIRAIRSGRSLQDLAASLQHIEEKKQDFSVPVSALSMNDQGKVQFKNGELHDFDLNPWSMGQVSEFANVPAAYARRLSFEAPDILAKNINHGFNLKKEEGASTRLVRTIDGRARAFLSASYRMLDSYDLLNAILPTLIDNQFEVASCELTDRRVYLKCTTQRIQGEVKKGDVVQYGVMVSTSDVGAGSLRVEPFFLRLECLNGMVSNTAFRKTHLGASRAEREVQEILSDSTKELNDQAFFATVKDYMLNTMRPEVFQGELLKMQDASQRPIKNLNLEQVVDLTLKTLKVTSQTAKKGILDCLADGNQNAGLNQWGLVNSFTAAAKMKDLDYDTATELERSAGKILDLAPSQWKVISEARH